MPNMKQRTGLSDEPRVVGRAGLSAEPGVVGLLTRERRVLGPSARVLAYDTLRDAIVRAQLEPGRRLSENELAAWLGVIRTPIREALVRLRDERLVEIVPQLGTFVTAISASAVADAQFIREALECAAVRVAAQRATAEDIEGLEQNLRAQDRAREAADHDAFYVLDDQ